MQNKKFFWIIIGILVLALLIALFLVLTKNSGVTINGEQTKKILQLKSNDQNGSAPQVSDNIVKCDIDDRKGVTFKMINVNYAASIKSTMFMAQEQGIAEGQTTPILQFSFPGKTATKYSISPTDSNEGLHYGALGNSYQSDNTGGDKYEIVVTKYSGNNVEGTFSGTMTGIGTDGWDKTKKITLSNCSFSSGLEIKSL